MIEPLELTGLTKVFETPAGPFVAVKDVNVQVKRGEFVCILGHSGCGKSTVLSMIAGPERATLGGVVIDGREVRRPGRRARRGVSGAVSAALAERAAERRSGAVERRDGRRRGERPPSDYLALVGVVRQRRPAAGGAVARDAAVRVAGAGAVDSSRASCCSTSRLRSSIRSRASSSRTRCCGSGKSRAGLSSWSPTTSTRRSISPIG